MYFGLDVAFISRFLVPQEETKWGPFLNQNMYAVVSVVQLHLVKIIHFNHLYYFLFC